MEHSLSSFYLNDLLSILKKMGFDATLACPQHGLTPENLSNPKYRFPLVTIRDIFNRAEDALDEPNIGLKAGAAFRVHGLGQTGRVLAHVETIADAVTVNARYECLAETVGICGLKRDETGVHMMFDTDVDPNLDRHTINLIVAGYAVTTFWLGWSFEGKLEKAGFTHVAPDRAADYEKIFQCPVAFNQPENFITFAPDVADHIRPAYNPEQLSAICSSIDPIRAKFMARSAFLTRFNAAVMTCWDNGDDIRDTLAKACGLTQSELAHELRVFGLSKSAEIDRLRQNLCLDYLSGPNTLTNIAHSLGFSDSANFTRAFRRWHNMTPSDYRKQML